MTDAQLVAKSGDGDNAPPLSVSEISGALKRVVEDRFGFVRVRGEISGFKRAASGHVYLALKDEKAVIDGVMWKGNVGRIGFAPEDGVEVIVSGKLTTYAGRSKYQIVIEQMELAGEGALMQLFEKLKAKLLAEGLFEQDRKQRLPALPRTIGVVTSPTGSVIRDILHRLADRFPSHVIVWPTVVQGEGAAEKIAAAIRGFASLDGSSAVARPDLVIVARGGGSLEDLWAFNEEAVVRAIAECPIPVISAVGHETDTTLADFAADMRAPTPTAAAEIAVPVRADWLATLSDMQSRTLRAMQRNLGQAEERLATQKRLFPALPDLLRPHQQRLDEALDRLKYALGRRVSDAQGRLASVAGGLRPRLLETSIKSAKERLDATWRLAQQLHPERPLERGYALVSDRNGKPIIDSKKAKDAQLLALKFRDGVVPAMVDDGSAMHRKAAPKRVKKAADDRQEDLF